jgi:hypothetical protein
MKQIVLLSDTHHTLDERFFRILEKQMKFGMLGILVHLK